MFSLLAPVEVEHPAPTDAATERKTHRAIRIAAAAAATIAGATLLFATLAFGTIGLRVLLYAMGHAEQPLFRDLMRYLSK